MKKEYLTKKEIKPNKIYDIEYMWKNEWNKGWGRLYTEDGQNIVNVITIDGGVSNVKFDNEVRFIKLTNL